jgi:hypothetical protein
VGYFEQGLASEQAGHYHPAKNSFTRALTAYTDYPEARVELEKAAELAARQH